MELSWPMIGVLVAVGVVGYFLGLLEVALKNNKKEDEEESLFAEEKEGSEAKKEEIPSAFEIDELEPEVLTIFKRVSGALKLRVKGEMVEYKSDLSVEQREYLLSLVLSLRPWLDGHKVVQPPAPLSPTIPVKTPQPSILPLSQENKMGEASDKNDFLELSMVEQIELILQENLKESPFAKHGVHLRASLSGELIFQVGLKEYKWLDEIPEQGIQDLIREAISEWENKAAPN
ncbi:MAG: hypothetical protein HN392_06025 [Anaerolineae bacterium]|jgi:hypothetical protein|nr:hypothetical protein [Anaerolineae bacterium]MBT7073426.1 hypothetical protein [Anaerolineae bacterium]MBT7781799.1 hypothetical protein [Anaerolineae bacterium]